MNICVSRNTNCLAYSVVFTLLLISNVFAQSAKPIVWSDTERAIIKNLWIGSLTINTDNTNRVINDPLAIQFGHNLFFDKRLSANGKIACASCHQPDKFFSDGLTTGKGLSVVIRNTPSIVGASQHTWFFHDGRTDSLWSQALGPIENELEHGSNRSHVAKTIYNDPTLRKQYVKLFGTMPKLSDSKRFPNQAGPVKDAIALKNWQTMSTADKKSVTEVFVNAGKAIAAYESVLQPAASRFDRYAEGVVNNNKLLLSELSDNEIKGLRIFISQAKCITCHSGPMFTDKGFHNISVQPLGNNKPDWGRYRGARDVLTNPFNCHSRYNDNKEKSCDELEYIVRNRHKTQGAMKTPSLRNVARTAPYMHAGQYKTLREVIKHYNDPPPVVFRRSELFLVVDLNNDEISQLEAFLKSLNSPINAKPGLINRPNIDEH